MSSPRRPVIGMESTQPTGCMEHGALQYDMSDPREVSVRMAAQGQRVVPQIDGRCSSRTGTRMPFAEYRMSESPAVSVRMVPQGQRFVGQNDRRHSSSVRTPSVEHDASEPPAGCIRMAPQGQTAVGRTDIRHRSLKVSFQMPFPVFFAI